MVDKKVSSDKVDTKRASVVPEAGKGMRNLDTWRKLASVRTSLSHDEAARAQFDSDPVTYFKDAGLHELAPSADRAGLTQLEAQLVEFASLDMEFVDRRQIASFVIGPVAIGVAVAAAGVVAAVIAAAAGQVVTVEQAYNWTRGWWDGPSYGPNPARGR
jgi:hypothetical protein